MKHSTMLLAAVLSTIALFSAACAPQGTPTPSLAELQATAMANAQAQVALTAAAIPTATQIPPTPIPTMPVVVIAPTEVVAPTAVVIQAQPIVPAAQSAVVASPTKSSADPCKTSTISGMKGPRVDVTFVAQIKGDVNMYFYIYKTAFGCGYGNVNLATSESTTVSIPAGCYDFYGWVNGPKPSTSSGYACFQKNQPATVRINADSIAVKLNNP